MAADLEFLCVDEYITDLVAARALTSAFELGLVDFLLERGAATHDELQASLACDRRGLTLLTDLLAANRVIEHHDGSIALSPAFRQALSYRDLLEARLDFAHLAAADCLEHFTALLSDPRQVIDTARTFALFDYARGCAPSPENDAATRRWMRITTALTRYEAGACLDCHDFGGYRQLLDIGGNSGEFALQACRAHPGLQATVFDLPVVCAIGAEHLQAEPEADRIRFIGASILADELPRGFDLITFKSMLHDWPLQTAMLMLAQAALALSPGGTLLIFERAPLPLGDAAVPYAQLPNLLFSRCFRPAATYERHLTALGLTDVSSKEVALDTPFLCTTGRKP